MNPQLYFCLTFDLLLLLSLLLPFVGSRSLELEENTTTPDEISTGGEDSVDLDPCSLLQATHTTLAQVPLLSIQHPVFNVSNSVVPGITYQVTFDLEVEYQFVLEFWVTLAGSNDDIRHHSYPPPPNFKKRRHQRDRRDSQWMEVSPAFSKNTPTSCSRNAFGGTQNESALAGSKVKVTFNWFLTANPVSPSTSPYVVFRLRFKNSAVPRSSVFEQILTIKVASECALVVLLEESERKELTLSSLWNSQAENNGLNCSISIEPPAGFGLKARLSSLSVYGIRDLCKGRFLSLQPPQTPQPPNAPHPPTTELTKYCGKIEDYTQQHKLLTFPSAQLPLLNESQTTPIRAFGATLKIVLPGYIKPRETFSIDLSTLSPCEQVTLFDLSGYLSYQRKSHSGESLCSIIIHVPYGNTISAQLTVSTATRSVTFDPTRSVTFDPSGSTDPSRSMTSERTVTFESESSTDDTENVILDGDENAKEFECILKSRKSSAGSSETEDAYFPIRIEDVENHSFSSGESETHHRIFCLTRRAESDGSQSLERRWKSLGNRMKLTFTLNYNFPGFELTYLSESVAELRRDCDEGWVHVSDSGCVLLVERGGTWTEAEEECQGHGGHLVTVKSDLVQRQLQEIITHSGSWESGRAYWIGANDREAEGKFQWTSGLPFIFSNWFPGTREGGAVFNVQPNDDGLSGQDCVELRQDFAPLGPTRILDPPSYPLQGKTAKVSQDRFEKISKTKSWPIRRSKMFHWNDRNCQTLNFFLCERVTHPGLEFVCNRTVRLSPGTLTQSSSVTVTTPAYPSSYPDNTLCITRVETVPGHRLVVTFQEFHLEDSPGCKYDSLELFEEQTEGVSANRRKICGEWNRRLKLLRFVSTSSTVSLKFESDFSHALPGFKANIATEKVIPVLSYEEEVGEECKEQHMQGFKSNCYLVVSSSTVTFDTAQELCSSLQGNLVSIVAVDEWRFVTQLVVASSGYQRSNIYWLGGYIDKFNQLAWKDRMPFNYSAFHPSDLKSISEWKCLSLYWHEGGKGTFAWRLSNCNQVAGYICKKPSKVEPRPELNRTFVGIGGKVSSPKFGVQKYKDNLDYTVRLSSPEGTVIVVQFLHLDVEFQQHCLYDYVAITDQNTQNSSQVCGTFTGKDLERFDFVSSSNGVEVVFHSDYSETFTGFELTWRAVDVTECLSGKRILTGLGKEGALQGSLHQGSLHSPNFPYFNLPLLNCVYTIVAPVGYRIWLHFEIFEVGESAGGHEGEEGGNSVLEIPGEVPGGGNSCTEGDHVVINLLSDTDSLEMRTPRGRRHDLEVNTRNSIVLCGNLTSLPFRTSFVSSAEKLRVQLISKEGRRGRGFLGKFKAVSTGNSGGMSENLVVNLQPNTSLVLTSLNFPLAPPPLVNVTTILTTPPNYIVSVEIRGVVTPNCQVKVNSFLVIHDPYVGTNGTSWIICNPKAISFGGRGFGESGETENYVLAASSTSDVLVRSRNVRRAQASSTSFHSTFNRLEITQVYKGQGPRTKWNAQVYTSLDENFLAKVRSGGDRLLLLDACTPNPCLNGGKCITDGDRHICRCALPYTGPFCGLSVCDLSPCLFGDCFVEDTSYRCQCYLGYAGDNCDRRAKPCMRDSRDREDKCSGRGECVEVNDTTYKCLCHAFWEGPRCESRMQNFPFRPLSERMLRDPFWLGIITVGVVLGVIGLAWCLKRHFPEKLEKFLNDDLDKNRRISWVSSRSPSSFRLGGGCSYHGVREAAVAGSSQQPTSPQTARSFLGRFAIRKPSLLSLSSATSVSAAATSPHTYENRTFSLDDLLRPSRSSMMRTPSPHRRRNFSIHSRREMPSSEKQQILQQLVSSGASVSLDGNESKPSTPKPTIAEIIQMSEKRLRLANLGSSMQNEPSTSSFSIFMDKAVVENETSFSNNPGSSATQMSLSAASKAEKKVTFARLMDKLTAHDMSSSSSCSDLSCAEDNTRTIVVNPKPPKKDRKGRLKRSKAWSRGRNSETDQDGFEMSSSDTTPDPICPPRFPSRVCVSPTGLSVSANNSPSSKTSGKSIPKMASADSLLALFRRFSGSGSAPPSPQYSENEESSAGATPLSTPSSPRNSALSLNIRPPAFLITTPEGSVDASTSPGHDQSGAPGSWRSQAQNMNVISLEVPLREHCLSPIHEVPTPLPTPSHSPAHSPMMHRSKEEDSSGHCHGLPMIKLQPSSDVDEDETVTEKQKKPKADKKFPLVIPKISISEEGEDCMILLTDPDPIPILQTDTDPIPVFDDRRWTKCQETIPDVLIHGPSELPQRFSFDEGEMSRADPGSSPIRTKGRPPPLIFANEIMSETKTDPFKTETVSDRSDRSLPMSIPVVNVQDPTPTGTPAMTPIQEELPIRSDPIGSKPIPPDITAFAVMVSPKPWDIQSMRQTASHVPLLPPMIMVNQNSEPESDSDSTIRKLVSRKPNLAFLSPFVGTADRVPSESNLSTSGYSSMASPCPSRCPSVSPLCPDMMDDYHGPGHTYHTFRRSSLVTPGSSRKSSLTLTPRRLSLNATSPLVSSFASNLLGMGSTCGISSFGESMELLETDPDHVTTETEPETGDKKPRNREKEDETPELPEEFQFQQLLQVPRKNLPKSRSLDIPERGIGGGQRSNSRTNQGEVKNQPIRKGDSLDSKLNSCSGMPNTAGFPALEFPLTKTGIAEIAGNSERKRLSPVSSRSDSSMSELSVIGLVGGFTSPMTDSDGVYDCASSEVQSGTGNSREIRKCYANSLYLSPSQQIRRSGRRKNRRKMSAGGKKSVICSPVSTVFPLQDGKNRGQGQGQDSDTTEMNVSRLATLLRPALLKKTPTSSTSPKRRVRAQTNLDVTSSSSESINSLRTSRSRLSSPSAGSPKLGKPSTPKSPVELDISPEKNDQNVDSVDNKSVSTLPLHSPSPCSEGRRRSRDRIISPVPRSRHRNISRSRLRTISLQIRFLRRLERSLIRKREKLNSGGSVRGQSGSSESCSSCSLCSTSSSSSSTSSSEEEEDGGERSRLVSTSTK